MKTPPELDRAAAIERVRQGLTALYPNATIDDVRELFCAYDALVAACDPERLRRYAAIRADLVDDKELAEELRAMADAIERAKGGG